MTSVYVQQNCTADILSQKEELSAFTLSHGLGELSWIEGKGNGKDAGRDLMKLLRTCRKDDVVVVYELTRICRALSRIYEVMQLCQTKGVRLYSIVEGYAFGDPLTSPMMTYSFGMAVEAEKRIRSFRTREGLADLRASGAKLGRRVGSTTKLNMLDEKRQRIASLAQGGASITDISHKLGVSHSTMYKYFRIHPELRKHPNLS